MRPAEGTKVGINKIAIERIYDGLTKDMMHRVAAHLALGGDLYLIADAGDMSRARDALADYRLAIRWPECQQFDTNLIGKTLRKWERLPPYV